MVGCKYLRMLGIAKKNDSRPYNVLELKFTDFYDLTALSADLIRNRNIDEEGKKVNWLK